MLRSNYFLLKFFNEIKTMRGRKKFQKIIYILKYIGCPIEYRFFMHYYGPYSSDLASSVDNLVEKDLLSEGLHTVGLGLQEFSYKLTSEGKIYLKQLEKNDIDGELRKKTAGWVGVLKTLNNDFNVNELELTSTILYWHDWGYIWNEAQQKARIQKNISQSDKGFQNALDLAGEFKDIKASQ